MRLFVALDLPEETRRALAKLIARLRPICPSGRWVRPEGIHVTLKFIGHADENKLGVIESALAPVRSDEPVEIEFRGLGFFPNERRPRVLWCGAEASKNLAKLAADAERALEPLNVPAESRPFVPHLTLARLQPGETNSGELEGLVRAAGEIETQTFGLARADEFHLFESVLKPSGAEYKRLRTFRFAGGPA